MANFCRDLCEGLIGNCRNCMTAPITRTKIYWFTGIMVVIILIIIIICVSIPSGGPSSSGSDALSNGVASGLFYLPPDSGETTTVKDFNKTTFDFLASNKIRLQIFGAETNCTAQYKDAVSLTMDQVDFLGRLLQNVSTLSVAKSADDIQRAFGNGKISSMISVVGGHAIDNRLALLRVYHVLGVRVMTVVADGCSTPWGKAASDTTKKTVNFNPFGKAVIKEMNRLGILIDIAGADKETQSAILDASEAPVVAIGIGLSSINPNPLNLDATDVVPKFVKNNGLLMLSTDCALLTATSTNCTTDAFTAILKEAKKNNIKVGIGGNLNRNSKFPLNFGNWENYFNNLYDSKEFSLDYLRGLAKDNFMSTLRSVEKVSKESGNMYAGETFFDWTVIKHNKTCYTYPVPSPTPTEKPAEKPTDKPTENPTEKSTEKPPK